MDGANGNGTAGLSQAERRSAILEMAGVFEEEPAVLETKRGPIDVLVREMSGRKAKEFEIAVAKGSPDAFGFLMQQSIVDPETKELLFEPADRAQLEELGVSRLNGISQIALRLSGLSKADVDKAKELLASAPSIG